MWWVLARFFSNLVLHWSGQAAVEGVERLPRTGPLIVAVNHVSWADPVLAGSVVDRVRSPFFLGKQELYRGWFSRWVLLGLHSVPLDRGRGDVGALRKAEELLGAGGCLVLFPEGTRSRTGLPGRPKPGIGFLAQRTGAAVVPARVFGTRGWMGWGKVAIKFGAPIRFSGQAGKEHYQAFADSVMKTLFSLEMEQRRGSGHGPETEA